MRNLNKHYQLAFGSKILPIVLILVCEVGLHAQTDLTVSDLGNPSLISPYYFGPNAFPIPDVIEGTTSHDLRLELGADFFHGCYRDKTVDTYLKLNIPLFSERVNLSAWMPIMEWWRHSSERQLMCRTGDESKMKGREAGDVYVSTDIWLLKAERFKVDVSVRAAVKTASGNGFANARYYDSPAYFFDASISKPFMLSGQRELRLSCSSGFLCWQTDNGRQNDAVMYGIVMSLNTRRLTIRESFGGYVGWESFAAYDKSIRTGDCPMSLKSDMIFHYNNLDFILRYQIGLHDWPFHQFRFGIAYYLDIL